MNPAQVSHHRAAHHDVVKVRDDEVRSAQVHVGRKRSQEQAGQASHREEADKSERVEHRRFIGDRAFIKRRSPVEDFNRRRNRHQKTEHGKNQACIDGLARHEHVMAPHQETDYRNRHARKSHDAIPEDPLFRKARYDFADHAHRRQNHDVHRRV